MRKDWYGLIKIIDIKHLSSDGKVLWQSSNLYNMLHHSGQQYILQVFLTGGVTTPPPSNIYFGLDKRGSVLATDTMSTINNGNLETSGNGYDRVTVSATSGLFVFSQATSGIWSATSPILTFSASGSGWTANNIFMTNSTGYGGSLISSVVLPTSLSVNSGEVITMKMSLSLEDISES